MSSVPVESDIELSQRSASEPEKKNRVPRRVIHCSDGVVEEFSTDDEDESDRRHPEEDSTATTVINPSKLAWVPWIVHYTVFAGKGFFKYCDHYGEKIAWFLGITSPRYYYEIEDFKRSQEEEEEEARKNELETVGWREETTDAPIKSEPPSGKS